MAKSNLILISVVLIIMWWSIGCFAIEYNTPTVITDSLTVDDVLILNGTSITFQTSNITIAGNVSLVIIGQCSIISTAPLSITFSSLNTSNITPTSSLTLTNVNLVFSNSSSVAEITFDMRSSGSMTFLKDALIQYNVVPSGTVIFNGGDLVVGNGVTFNLDSNTVPTYDFTSTLHNQYRFVSAPNLHVYPSQIIGAVGSFFFFDELHSLSPSQNLVFVGSLVYFKLINLGGATMTLTNSTWSMQSYPSSITSYVENTNVILKQNVILNYYRNSTLYPQGLIYLRPNGYLDIQSPSTLTIALQYNFAIYILNTTQSQLVFSENGGINCHNAANARFKPPKAANSPNIYIQNTSPISYSNASIDSIVVCSAQGLSSRTFNMYSDGFYTNPPCPNGMVQCISGSLQNRCYNITTNPCSITCFKAGALNTAIPSNFEFASFDSIYGSGSILAASPETYMTSSSQRQLLAINVGEKNFTCWNGECVASLLTCPPFPACPPSLPKRCPGYCVEPNGTCITCNATNPYRCESGCSNYPICQPYDGCSMNETMCPNMACVNDPKDCAQYIVNGDPNQLLELSYKFVPSTSDIYPKSMSYVPLWTRNITDNSSMDTSTHVIIGSGSVDINQMTSSVVPYADSLARNISGTGVIENFDYYKNVVSGVFNIKIDGRNQSQFNNGTVNIIFGNLRSNVSTSDLCLAFINASGAWECTEYNVTQLDNGGYLAQTNHFTSFALLLKTKKDDDSANDGTGVSKSKMSVIIGSVVGSVVVVAVVVGLIVNFKIKHNSIRRWSVHRSDPNMTKKPSRFRLKTFRSLEKLGEKLGLREPQ